MNAPSNTIKCNNPRIVVAGAVNTTKRIIKGLMRNGANIVGVLGLSRAAASCVSDYSRFDDLASENKTPYMDFNHINDSKVIAMIRQWKPDILFAVGFSQLVRQELLQIPRIGCVGYHPTCLPQDRGRAPIAWLVLEGHSGAASFFEIGSGIDNGAIFVQEPFEVNQHDYAEDVISRENMAIDIALDTWIPRLIEGEWNPTPQDETVATVNGQRVPVDGLIDWRMSAAKIYSLIRATSHPHPGAYTYVDGSKLTVWRALVESAKRYRGVTGRILRIDNNKGALIQTGCGLLWLTQTEGLDLKVGQMLGYRLEDEIQKLRERITNLEIHIKQLSS